MWYDCTYDRVDACCTCSCTESYVYFKHVLYLEYCNLYRSYNILDYCTGPAHALSRSHSTLSIKMYSCTVKPRRAPGSRPRGDECARAHPWAQAKGARVGLSSAWQLSETKSYVRRLMRGCSRVQSSGDPALQGTRLLYQQPWYT